MKFRITDIQNQDYSQINVLVDIANDSNALLVKRVFTLPFDKFSNLDNTQLIAWVTNEVKIAKETAIKELSYKTLINQVFDI